MKASLIYKINFLIMGLAITGYLIYALNTKGLNPKLQALFGFETKTPTNYRLNWCDTRVAAMIKPNEMKLEQQGDKWLVDNHTRHEVDFISVEKWFGKYCAVDAIKTQTADLGTFSPTLIVKFITGQVEVLKRSAAGVYLWQGQAFSSSELDSAMAELVEFQKSGRK